MTARHALSALCAALLWIGPVFAQAWVQVEARPTLAQAQERARAYEAALGNVEGYRLRSGWYAIALGPFEPNEARRMLLDLRRSGIIPRDAYVTDRRPFREKFWPAGAGTALPAPSVPQAPAIPAPQTPPGAQIEDETPAEARRSEAALDRDARGELQIALQWFGFYTGAIDGAFGRGTRASMADWQRAKGFPASGVLTTGQRAELLGDYAEALKALGLGEVVDRTAGLSLTMPAELVEFDRYETPFARYLPKGDSGITVLLISQEGDEDTLAGLFDLMQVLELVPVDGERSITPSAFTIIGQSDALQSYTYARLDRGTVKGFLLAYPPARAAEMSRVIPIMRESLSFLNGVLDDRYRDLSDQSVDLISGLEIRQPKRAASGFYVSSDGDIVTASSEIGACERITIDDAHRAEVVANDGKLALLRSEDALAPIDFARFLDETPPLRSDVIVGGYSYGGDLNAPTVTYGILEDVWGLHGERDVKRLGIEALPGDTGGPVLSPSGAISGMLLAEPVSGRDLPPRVRFALKSDEILRFLQTNGIEAARASEEDVLAAEDLVTRARDMTVLVSCW